MLLVLLMYFSLAAQQIEVCNTCPIKTIAKAVSIANRHDVILLKEGNYAEHDIVIDKPLSIHGEKNAVINGEEKGYIFKVFADSVSIKGITLKNVGRSYTKDYAAIYLSKSK